MKKFLLISTISLLIVACQQQAAPGKENANVDRIQGKYVYIHSQPTQPYIQLQETHLDLLDGVVEAGEGEKGFKKFLKVMTAASGKFNFDNRLSEIIQELNANNVDFDGIIFPNDLKNGYAIKFQN